MGQHNMVAIFKSKIPNLKISCGSFLCVFVISASFLNNLQLLRVLNSTQRNKATCITSYIRSHSPWHLRHTPTPTIYSTILFNSSCFIFLCFLMSVSNRNNGVRVERRELAAPKNLMEVIIMLADAIMLLCYTERRYMFNLPRVIAHAVLDKVVS